MSLCYQITFLQEHVQSTSHRDLRRDRQVAELRTPGVWRGWLSAEYRPAGRPWVSIVRGTQRLEKGAERKVGGSEGKLH